MGINERYNFSGEVTMTVYDSMGNVKSVETTSNIVVDTGLALGVQLLGATTGGDRLSHIAIGTNDTEPTATDTSLGDEIDRESASFSIETKDVNDDTLVATATFSFQSETTVRETGIFNASSGGTMFARTLKGPTTVEADDSIQIEWRITSQRNS